MRVTPLLLLPLLACPACFQLKMAAQVGYTQMAVSGDLALSTTVGGLGTTVDQDFESAFGLGDPQGSPYARAQVDFGVPVLTVSAFTFEEQGTGRLTAQYGTLTAGTDVSTDLKFVNAKASYLFQIDVGPVAIAPGIAVDLFDLQMHVQDTGSSSSEDVDVQAPVPMAMLRAEVDLAVVGAYAEVGYVKVPKIQDIEGTFWDAEVMAEVRPTNLLHLFAGYRFLHADGNGTVDNQDFSVNLDVTGWMIGGGVRF